MAIDLRSLLDPATTAVVTQELQKGVFGEQPIFPQLAEAARLEMIPNAARLLKAARAADVAVVHAIAARRRDGVGYNANARLFGAARKSGVVLEPGTPATEVIDELDPQPSDLTSVRMHGIGPFWGTDLDPILRNLGVRTVVAIGASVNVGVTNLIMDAVNAGYQVVMPRDAVAGIPKEYADAVIDNTLALLATVTTTDEIIEVWTTADARSAAASGSERS
ncbi:MAG: cysteine hydrolase [Actinomycetota bacterium]